MAHKNTNWVEETLKQRTADRSICPECGYEANVNPGQECPKCGETMESTKAVQFTESLHPRNQGGQFSSSGGGGGRMPRHPGGGGPPEVYTKPIKWEGNDDDSSSGVVTTPDGKKLRVRARKIKKPGYEKTPYRSSYTLDGKEQGRQYHPDMASAKARLLKIHAQLMAGKTAKGG